MPDSTLLIALIVFVAISAVSQLVQLFALLGLKSKLNEIHEDARPLMRKAEATLESAKITIDEGRKQMLEISKKTTSILDSAQAQLTKIDSVVTDASDRAKVQLERAELIVNDTVEKVQGLVNTTQDGLMKPLREVSALITGVKGAFGFLFKGSRPTVVHATQDEEMFI